MPYRATAKTHFPPHEDVVCTPESLVVERVLIECLSVLVEGQKLALEIKKEETLGL